MLIFLLGFFLLVSAQIYVSEGTSFVIKEGTPISASTASKSDSESKKEKVKIYVKSKKTAQNITESEQLEIVLLDKSKLDESKNSKNKSFPKKRKSSKNLAVKTETKENNSDYPRIAKFPVSRSCLSNSDGSVDAIVPASQIVKKTSIKPKETSITILIEIDLKLQDDYFQIDEISDYYTETYSIRPPPVFRII